MHQQKVEQMIKSAEGNAGLCLKITMPTPWRGGTQILEKEEDAKLLDRCEAKRKEWAKHWQCDEDVQNLEDKPWKNEEMRRMEEALRLKEELEKASRMHKAKTGVGCDGFHPKVLLDLTNGNERRNSWRGWSRVANGTTIFFLIPKNVTSERPIAMMPRMIRWWEALWAPEVAKWQQKWDATYGRNGGANKPCVKF